MPTAPPHGCIETGCQALVPRGKGRCPTHERARGTHIEQSRGSSYERGYNKAWGKARLAYLREHPLCAQCTKEGRVTAARVVDHIIDHRGDQKIFWDKENWQALCDYTSVWNCHGKKTGREAGGRANL